MIVGTSELDSFDPESMEEAVKGASLQHVQLGRGRFRGRLLGAQLHQWRLDYGRHNLPLHALGPMPNDRVTLGFIPSGTGPSSFNGHVIEQPVPVVLGEGAELDYRLAPQTEWLAFQVARDALEQLGVSSERHSNGPVGYRHTAASVHIRQSLRHAVASLREIADGSASIAEPEAFCEKVLASVFDDFLAVLQSSKAPSVGNLQYPAFAQRLSRQAVEYIDAHYEGTVQIGLMCGELETSWKSLERSFLRVYGMTPKQYLGFARLAKARRRLLQSQKPGKSVAQIAVSCGINHLGRFAQLYRATYGELPSATVAK
jgi:AraC-like DNA-binding protein